MYKYKPQKKTQHKQVCNTDMVKVKRISDAARLHAYVNEGNFHP